MDSISASERLNAIRRRSSIRRKTLVDLFGDRGEDNGMMAKNDLRLELKLESIGEQESTDTREPPLLLLLTENIIKPNSMQYMEHINRMTITAVKFVLMQIERKIFQSVSGLREILIRTSIITLPDYLQQYSVRYTVMDIIERLKRHDKLLCCTRLDQLVFVNRSTYNEQQMNVSHCSAITTDSYDTADAINATSGSHAMLSYDKAQCGSLALRKLARQKIWSFGMKTDEKTLIEVADLCDYFSRLSKTQTKSVKSRNFGALTKVKSVGFVIDLHSADCVHIFNVFEYTNRELYLIKEVVNDVLANIVS